MSSETTAYFERLRMHLRLGDPVESDLVRELATHVEDRVGQLVADGMPEARARETAIAGLGRPQTLAHLVRQAHLVTPWTEALAGAAAFLLVGLMIGTGLWQQPLAAAAAGTLVIAVTLYGLWLGRPAWFYPWAGIALTIPIIVGYIAFAVIHREVPLLLDGTAGPLGLAGFAGSLLYFAVGLVVVAAAMLVAVRRDWLDASVLISPLPCALVWVIAIHRAGGITSAGAALTDTGALLCAIYVCMAVAAVVFLRAPVRSLKVTTLVGAALVLFLGSTLLLDPSGGLVSFAGRAALLLAFLLSPALVARQA